MKTCSFRGAIVPVSSNFDGIFCLERPCASYGMAPCRKANCHFCSPPMDVPNRARRHQPVVLFSPAHEHIFINGYRTILNCPTVSLYMINETIYFFSFFLSPSLCSNTLDM
jgi:hypothetical protein